MFLTFYKWCHTILILQLAFDVQYSAIDISLCGYPKLKFIHFNFCIVFQFKECATIYLAIALRENTEVASKSLLLQTHYLI